jgi:GxxExxY protein
LLESVYETVLAYELDRRGLRTVRQQPIPVVYENIRIDAGFRADLVVEDKVIVEINSVESLAPVHKKQLLTYLRLADKRLGLLINFHVVLIKDGITRIVNGSKKIFAQSRLLAKRTRTIRRATSLTYWLLAATPGRFLARDSENANGSQRRKARQEISLSMYHVIFSCSRKSPRGLGIPTKPTHCKTPARPYGTKSLGALCAFASHFVLSLHERRVS